MKRILYLLIVLFSLFLFSCDGSGGSEENEDTLSVGSSSGSVKTPSVRDIVISTI